MYIPCTTCLHILLAQSCLYYYLLSLQYTVLHIFYSTFYIIFYYFLFCILTFYFLLHFFPYLYLCIFSCFYISYNYTVHGADLTYISLLIIFCIIVYVTNKTLNLECKGVAVCCAVFSAKSKATVEGNMSLSLSLSLALSPSIGL